MEKIVTVATVSVACVGIVAAALVGLSRSEAVECFKWQRQAEQYPGFYLTEWQARQCAAKSIIISAPVK